MKNHSIKSSPRPFALPVFAVSALMSLVACAKFEVARPNIESETKTSASVSQLPSQTTATNASPSPTPEPVEPALPAMVRTVPKGRRTMANILAGGRLSTTGTRRSLVGSELLGGCYSRVQDQVIYDSRLSIPVVPDAVHEHVEGDLLIRDANRVDLQHIDGVVTVENSEIVSSVQHLNLEAPTGDNFNKHSFISRLIRSMSYIAAPLFTNALAISDVDYLVSDFTFTAHAVGQLGAYSVKVPTEPRLLPKWCGFAQEIGSIDGVVGSLALFSRDEGGDAGVIGQVTRLKGKLAIFGFNVSGISNYEMGAGDSAYIEEAYVGELSGRLSGDIYLNSTKVDRLNNIGSSRVRVHLANGSEVASTSGDIDLINE